MLASLLSSFKKGTGAAAGKARSVARAVGAKAKQTDAALARAGKKVKVQGSSAVASVKRAAHKGACALPARARPASCKAKAKAKAPGGGAGGEANVVRRMTRQMAAQHALPSPGPARRSRGMRGGDSTSLTDSCTGNNVGVSSLLALTSAQSSQFATGAPYSVANPNPNNVVLNSIAPSSLDARGVDTSSFTGEGLLRSTSYSADLYSAGGARSGPGRPRTKAPRGSSR